MQHAKINLQETQTVRGANIRGIFPGIALGAGMGWLIVFATTGKVNSNNWCSLVGAMCANFKTS